MRFRRRDVRTDDGAHPPPESPRSARLLVLARGVTRLLQAQVSTTRRTFFLRTTADTSPLSPLTGNLCITSKSALGPYGKCRSMVAKKPWLSIWYNRSPLGSRKTEKE